MYVLIGYYRVNYDDKSWFAIALILQESHSTIHVVNRAQVSIIPIVAKAFYIEHISI